MSQHQKIMLVDDDADDLLFFFEALREIDPALVCAFANHGAEAIDLLEKVPPLPSLIFLDLNMPRMSGIEFLEKIRPTHKTIPVVMYTTSNNPEDEKRALAAGANHFLIKPTNFENIKAQLKNALEMDFSGSATKIPQ